MKAKLINKIKIMDDIWSFEFTTENKMDYIAGQFIELTIEKSDSPNQKTFKRWFTLSSSPAENKLAITTRISPENQSDFKRELSNLHNNQNFDISQAMGDFVLTRDLSAKLTFIAFGIGVTPFRSIINQLSETNTIREINLIYISKSNGILPFEELFKNYLKNNIYTYSSIKKLENSTLFNDVLESKYIYIAGAEEKVMNFRNKLVLSKVEEDSIICDYFPGY